MSLRPPDFDRLLVPGARVDTATGWATITDPLRVEVDLPSGEVVASAWDWEPIGFTVTAPPGRYPVLLYSLFGFPVDGGEASLIDARR